MSRVETVFGVVKMKRLRDSLGLDDDEFEGCSAERGNGAWFGVLVSLVNYGQAGDDLPVPGLAFCLEVPNCNPGFRCRWSSSHSLTAVTTWSFS